MKIRTMALFGFVTFALVGAGAAACSSSNSGNPSSTGDDDSGTSNTGHDSGTASNNDSGGGTNPGDDDSGSGATGDSGSTTDAGCKVPTLHVPTPDGGIYCPYSFNDVTDSGTQYCTNGTQQCCLSPGGDAGPSTCTTFGSACPTADLGQWQCASPADCVGANPTSPDGGSNAGGTDIVCCLLGGSLTAESTTCSTYSKTHFGGTTCQPKAQCQGSVTVGTFSDPLYIACEQNSDCPGTAGGAAQTCMPIFTTGTAIGICTPQN